MVYPKNSCLRITVTLADFSPNFLNWTKHTKNVKTKQPSSQFFFLTGCGKYKSSFLSTLLRCNKKRAKKTFFGFIINSRRSFLSLPPVSERTWEKDCKLVGTFFIEACFLFDGQMTLVCIESMFSLNTC